MRHRYVTLEESDIIWLAKRILDREPSNDNFQFDFINNSVVFNEVDQRIKVKFLQY